MYQIVTLHLFMSDTFCINWSFNMWYMFCSKYVLRVPYLSIYSL